MGQEDALAALGLRSSSAKSLGAAVTKAIADLGIAQDVGAGRVGGHRQDRLPGMGRDEVELLVGRVDERVRRRGHSVIVVVRVEGRKEFTTSTSEA